MTDHHDFAGLPNMWRGIQTLLGLEYRPQYYINIYNRIRNLDFTGEDEMPLSIVQSEFTKHNRQKSRKSILDFNSTKADQDSEVSITDILENEIESQVCNSKLYDL